VVLVFGICYFPAALAVVFNASNLDKELISKIYILAYVTTLVNSAVNFMIYCLMSPKFRSTFIKLWIKSIPRAGSPVQGGLQVP